MSIVVGDVVFGRDGRPQQVTSKDRETGEITLERDFDAVRRDNVKGVKNGLDPSAKEAFRSILSQVQDPDKKLEIDKLMGKVNELKKNNIDPRLMRYLENELHFRMTRERYMPAEFPVNAVTLTSY